MRVPLGGRSVGRPARVRNAGGAVQRQPRYVLGQRLDAARELAGDDASSRLDRHARRVVAAILEPAESFQEDRRRLALADVAHDAAHARYPSSSARSSSGLGEPARPNRPNSDNFPSSRSVTSSAGSTAPQRAHSKSPSRRAPHTRRETVQRFMRRGLQRRRSHRRQSISTLRTCRVQPSPRGCASHAHSSLGPERVDVRGTGQESAAAQLTLGRTRQRQRQPAARVAASRQVRSRLSPQRIVFPGLAAAMLLLTTSKHRRYLRRSAAHESCGPSARARA